MTTPSPNLAALADALAPAQAAYDEFVAAGNSLDLTRGKPCAAQLDLSEGMLALPGAGHHTSADAGDVRNYGGTVLGLRALREIFAPLVDVPVDQLVARDNSSLALMHQCVATSFFDAPPGGTRWMGESVAFLAPSPGYDRHFAVCRDLGVELIDVPMTDEGPDMAAVRTLVRDDPRIKGIWCVPKYANPTGITYSPRVVQELASMPVAAADFRIYWDNAYAVHHVRDRHDELDSVLEACAAAGNPDRAFVFASSSKVSMAGAGVSFFGSSPANVEWFTRHDAQRSIGPDKVNQLRHIEFFRDSAGVVAHMERHREILEPKFDAVLNRLDKDLAALGIARWTDPRGGYFVNLDVVPGTAKRVVALAKGAGVALTPAGAAYANGDPVDENIRIAPTFPTMAELDVAMEVLTTCVIIAAAEALL